MKSFNILGRVVEFDDNQCLYRDYKLKFKEFAPKSEKRFAELYKSSENVDSCMRNMPAYCYSALEEPIEYILKGLKDHNIHGITKESFLECYAKDVLKEWAELYYSIEEKYVSIVLDKEQMEEYRRERKANRSRWIGGGFGFSGAIKGAVQASVMNAVGGMAHGMVNAIGNAFDSADANINKSRLLYSETTKNALSSAVYLSVIRLESIFYDLLRQYASGDSWYSKEDDEFSRGVIHNVFAQKPPETYFFSDDLPDDTTVDMVIEAIKRYPFIITHYQWLFLCFGDKENEITQISEYFGYNLQSEKDKIKEAAKKGYSPENRESMDLTEERLLFINKKYGFVVTQSLRKINRERKELSLKLRTVHDLVTDYKVGQVPKANIKLSDIDIVKDTEQEAEDYREGIEIIIRRYNTTYFHSKKSLEALYEEVLSISEKFSMGQCIVDELKARIEVLDVKDKLEQVKSGMSIDSVGLDETNDLSNIVIAQQEIAEINSSIDANKKRGHLEKIEAFRLLQKKKYLSDEAKELLKRYEKDVISDVSHLKTNSATNISEIKFILGSAAVGILAVLLIPVFGIPAIVVTVLCALSAFGTIDGLKTLKKNNSYYEEIQHNIDWDTNSIKSDILHPEPESNEPEKTVDDIKENKVSQERYCVYCGKKIDKASRFCNYCGEKVD